ECPSHPECCGSGGFRPLDTVRTYDANDDLLSETDPEGNVKTYTYDVHKNQLSKTEGGRTTTYTYNACNKVLTEELPQTPEGRHLTTYTYDDDATGCNVRYVTDALGHVTEYQYDAAGRVRAMIDANGNPRTWDYDTSGFLMMMTDSLGKSAMYHFSAAGDLL